MRLVNGTMIGLGKPSGLKIARSGHERPAAKVCLACTGAAESKQTKPKKVVVVGGGWAGVMELSSLGCLHLISASQC